MASIRKCASKKITRAAIKKAAIKANVDLSLIKITLAGGVYGIEDADLPADLSQKNVEFEGPGQLPEVEAIIRKYNREARKLVNALDCEYWSYKTGYGAWCFVLGPMSNGEKLAFANMD